jgi:tetraacyldisaccharide 4'-kinase
MENSLDQRILPILSGQRRDAIAALCRASLRLAEIPYAMILRLRNGFYDRGVFKSHRLARPVISVGNITTGGTGKTPVVRWLAENLSDLRPAILLRGYKSAAGFSDEQLLLQVQLPNIPIIARPDRRRGAAAALARQHDTGLFILDDGFQHRQIAHDFDLVLIDATNPFGFGHVLPRGLLREPLAGSARADAFLVTRSSQVAPTDLQDVESVISRHNSRAPIYHADHILAGVRCGEQSLSIDSLRGKRLFLFCGIGNPTSLRNQLAGLKLTVVGFHIFSDHHSYSAADLDRLSTERSESRADLLITTEKDWTKIASLNHPITASIGRVQLSITFRAGDEAKLLELVRLSISRPAR